MNLPEFVLPSRGNITPAGSTLVDVFWKSTTKASWTWTGKSGAVWLLTTATRAGTKKVYEYFMLTSFLKADQQSEVDKEGKARKRGILRMEEWY